MVIVPNQGGGGLKGDLIRRGMKILKGIVVYFLKLKAPQWIFRIKDLVCEYLTQKFPALILKFPFLIKNILFLGHLV